MNDKKETNHNFDFYAGFLRGAENYIARWEMRGDDWDSVPNPARNLRFLDFPIRFAAV